MKMRIKVTVLLIGLCLFMFVMATACSYGKYRQNDSNHYSKATTIVKTVNSIMQEIETRTGCGKGHNIDPVEDLKQLAEDTESILSKVDDPLVLREILFTSDFRCRQWLRLTSGTSGLDPLEGYVSSIVESIVMRKLAAKNDEQSLKILFRIITDPNFTWHGEDYMLLLETITSRREELLPLVEDYIDGRSRSPDGLKQETLKQAVEDTQKTHRKPKRTE